jgi:hypothetical protein
MLRQIPVLTLFALFFRLQGQTSFSTFEFYGQHVVLPSTGALSRIVFPSAGIQSKTLNGVLNEMDRAGNVCVKVLKNRCTELELDNLGYFQLLKSFSLQCFPAQTPNFRKALVWYGLRQAGIDAILAGNESYLNLFVRMENTPDGGFSLTHKGVRYISASVDNIAFSQLEVWSPDLFKDSAREALQLDMYHTPRLGKELVFKPRPFVAGGGEHVLYACFNLHLVNYLNDLPSFRIGSYLYTLPPGAESLRCLDDSIRQWLSGQTYAQSLSFLLEMVQNAFPYKADSAYRTREKRNFVEQTLADDFVDCEDKAAFFCFLVNRYLSASTVLLYSRDKSHVACGIELPDKATNFSFKYLNRPYLICEPSFYGLKPGETELSIEDMRSMEIYN